MSNNKIDMSKIVYASSFAGLGARDTIQFSATLPAQNLAPDAGVIFNASASLPNRGLIPDVRIQFSGIGSKWYLLNGTMFYLKPDFSYGVTFRTYFTPTSIQVQAYIIEFAGTGISLPTLTLDCKASLYKAPFNDGI